MGEFKKRKASRLKKSEEQRKHDMRANAELSREAGMLLFKRILKIVLIASGKNLINLKAVQTLVLEPICRKISLYL